MLYFWYMSFKPINYLSLVEWERARVLATWSSFHSWPNGNVIMFPLRPHPFITSGSRRGVLEILTANTKKKFLHLKRERRVGQKSRKKTWRNKWMQPNSLLIYFIRNDLSFLIFPFWLLVPSRQKKCFIYWVSCLLFNNSLFVIRGN